MASNDFFQQKKEQVLGKRDKSSAGRIDPKAVEICAVINDRAEYYTTSSCSGRSYLYQGVGVKATSTFRRFRVAHDKISQSERYFDLTTLASDPTGGADPLRTIGQFEHNERLREMMQEDGNRIDHDANNQNVAMEKGGQVLSNSESDCGQTDPLVDNTSAVWLRFEPFILHVACRSLSAASALMNAARPAFKNVGLTTWKVDDKLGSRNFDKFLVAIWGDEGLEMPLCTPDGTHPFAAHHDWLASLVNERHQRNWDKIDRFVKAVREMPALEDEDHGEWEAGDETDSDNKTKLPRSFDIVGDIAVLNTLPDVSQEELTALGEAIMKKNKAIKIVVARQSSLEGTQRAPGAAGFVQLAGPNRYPLMTSHAEFGIKCVIDLNHTFFSPRMGPERLRICQQVARGEHVLVLFAGVGMEALQIAGRTEASSVVAVEMNPIAVQCLQRSHELLQRNRAVKCVGAAERLQIIEGDALRVIPDKLQRNYYDRVLAPRPKEGSLDGDLGDGDGGKQFLEALLPVLKQDGGECHWYDFAADHEFPSCSRTRELIDSTCSKLGLNVEVLHVANAGSVAIRQFRICVDFRISLMNQNKQ